MSHKAEQFASRLQRAVQAVMARGLQDPRIRGLITVTSVKVSQDRKEATVFVSVMPAEHEELTMHGLRGAIGHIRHEVGDVLDGERIPTLHLKVDSSTKKQAGVLDALAKVAAEREGATGKPPENQQ